MKQYQEEFINFMLDSGALQFGQFTLKSGRISPFFVNTGAYVTGSQLWQLGEFYAEAINDQIDEDFNVIFGPAYKGIPLAVATTMVLSEKYGKEVRYCSNRKELKDHGDAGILLGSPITDGDKVLMLEDVTTSGKSMEETVPIVRAQGSVEIVGLMVSINRQEKGKGTESALTEIRKNFGFVGHSIVAMDEVIEYIYHKKLITDDIKSKLDQYYQLYGGK